MIHKQAQINCQQKFGSNYSGRLVEPTSVDIGKALIHKAKALNVIKSGSPAFWIGYDQIGHGTGNFKYASTGLKSPLESITSSNWFDGDSGNASCITLKDNASTGAALDDEVCTTVFTSICEGF